MVDVRPSKGLLESILERGAHTTYRSSTLGPTQELFHSELTLSSSQTSPGLLCSNDFCTMRGKQLCLLSLFFEFSCQGCEIPLASGLCLLVSTDICLLLGLVTMIVGDDR